MVDVENLISYFLSAPEKTFQEFGNKFNLGEKYISTLKRQLQRKDILRCSKYNGTDGKIKSKKEVLISDLQVIKKLLNI